MAAQSRKLKLVDLALDGVSFESQLRQIMLANNTDDGDKMWVADGSELREETDPDYALELTFLADWRADGISQWLWDNDGRTVPWSAALHPDITAEHVVFGGNVYVKAPSVGGEIRTTEQTEVTLQVQGKPDQTRPGA
ncbi:hypothetical protein [Micromonospora sp. RTGN7]|uniref:hypothetical protein n=1 Tax=Micromonospora sp. RTGN7 TaxID=3016526 RepID=UPI0029FEFB39|nr:hypothetical protein [Micromonospora sp. RTGN7]